jgi:hypothetical protein
MVVRQTHPSAHKRPFIHYIRFFVQNTDITRNGKKKNQINVHGKPKAFSMKPSLLKKTRKKAKGEKDPNKGDR